MNANSQGSPVVNRVVVVGNGMVGHRFVELAADIPGVGVTVFGEEPRGAYDRVHLSDYFAGRAAADLALEAPPEAATVHTGERVLEIDRDAKTVTTCQGRTLDYDALVLATGSYPFVPPIDGRDRPHCHVYRTIEDLDAIRASGAGATAGVVVGAACSGSKRPMPSRTWASPPMSWSSPPGSWARSSTKAAERCCGAWWRSWAWRCTPTRTRCA